MSSNALDRRPEAVSIFAVLVHVILFVVFLLLSFNTNSAGILAASWYLLAGAGVWMLALVALHQQRMVRLEHLEEEELERERQQRLGGSRTVFEADDEEKLDALSARRRMIWIERYFTPVFSLMVAGYLLVMGMYLLPGMWTMPAMQNAMTSSVALTHLPVLVGFAAGAALLCFLVSRYAVGMSHNPQWRLLRAGGHFTTGNALVLFLVAAAVIGEYAGVTGLENVMGWVIPIVMIVLGFEIVVNFILDLYRPKVPGLVERASYESRLLGLISEPGGFLNSLAQAIDYQFGFKVSDTWFYHLLQRAIWPLVIFQAVVLLLLSSLVIVHPGQHAVIEHYGIGFSEYSRRIVGPGLHGKWPWPIDRKTMLETQRARKILVGFTLGKTPTGEQPAHEGEIPLLWTVKHYENVTPILIASDTTDTDAANAENNESVGTITDPDNTQSQNPEQADLVPVNLMSMGLKVWYNVEDGKELQYWSTYSSPDRVLELLANRHLIEYVASKDLEDLMTYGRVVAEQDLQEQLQAAVDARDLGLHIKQAQLIDIHPMTDVAPSFESVANALQEKQTMILRGQAQANRRIPLADANKARTINEAAAVMYDKVFTEYGQSRRFENQLKAYNASPTIYGHREFLRVLKKHGPSSRKYIAVVENMGKLIWISEEGEQLSAGLMGLGTKIRKQISDTQQQQ